MLSMGMVGRGMLMVMFMKEFGNKEFKKVLVSIFG